MNIYIKFWTYYLRKEKEKERKKKKMIKKIKIQDIEINIDSQISTVGFYIKRILTVNANPNP